MCQQKVVAFPRTPFMCRSIILTNVRPGCPPRSCLFVNQMVDRAASKAEEALELDKVRCVLLRLAETPYLVSVEL